ncbi:unnamed protein product [Tilletia controversa]|uniref:Protein kinase domain-containing protein n=3 Tax=Tilletia TaxID=13289 RepID=A0A8X7SVD5_9BASI|nr:hypothetical protein CF336_g7497 [Tilletia laevis]KAE8201759.1 hypothetical protein CF328_g2584 [Tilletia controversa]KAE8261272.1 hypothetical protein A4X03_0g3404 [Tilletia caries]KAE8202830.1 hypothetical protein CF335_g3258 [Tilletia laevis]KAE8245500.1 hypothetical protein A4X06_0g5660 [Tilletia controversa]
MSTEYRLRYAYQLCCGVQHLFKHGFCHGDLGLRNVLIAGSPPNDRVMVMDFEPVEGYHNKNGPTAPEVGGYWVVFTDERDGSTMYAHCDGEPVWEGGTIFVDWESIPEALERLMICNIGSMFSALLNVRVVFSWGPNRMHRDIQLKQDVVVGADPICDAWEASLPVDVRELTQRCCAYDPRERPLLDDVVEQLKKYVDSP